MRSKKLIRPFDWVNLNLVASFLGTVLIPLLYIINIKIAYETPNSFSAPVSIQILGLLIGLIGLIFWVISYINLGSHFGVLPQKQKRVKKGLYKYFSHPMYMGIYATFLGISIANKSWQGLIFLNIVIVPLLFFRAYFEEKKLV